MPQFVQYLKSVGAKATSAEVYASKYVMKPNRKKKSMRITEADYVLAQRRAARLEEIAAHGKPVSFRTALHKSKKIYSRKRLKKTDLPLL